MPAESPDILWTPSKTARETTRLGRFMAWVADRHGLTFPDYEAFWRWSAEEIEAFWEAIWTYYDIQSSTPYTEVLRGDLPDARWFVGATLNYAEHVLQAVDPDRLAIIHRSEDQPLREVRGAELRSEVARVATGLRALGIRKGDRVVGFLTNTPESVVAMLATTSIGAVWSSCSPELGVRSVVDRIGQLEPKLLFAVPGYRYNGKYHDRTDVLAEVRAAVVSLEHTVLLPSGGAPAGDAVSGLRWDDLGQGHAGEVPFERVPFDHPLWVLFSSGTTGKPKGFVHSHGGILLEHVKNANLQMDLGPGDRAFWFTTTSWMVWNAVIGYLLSGSAIMTFDGSPRYPDQEEVWRVAAEAKLTMVGTSPSHIEGCMAAGVEPATYDLSAVRSIGSAGSPLSEAGFRWLYEHVKPDAWVFSTMGGTEMCNSLAGGCSIKPVTVGEIQARHLGIGLEVWDDAGNPVVDEVGELVITRPVPAMPITLWGDPDGTRRRETYFGRYDRPVWTFGDWAEITSRGTVIVHGRSDSTINRNGIRFGTSEIYEILLDLPEIDEALVVDVPTSPSTSWMPVFVVLAAGHELSADLRTKIATTLRAERSPRHVPDDVFAVDDIPMTLTGKRVEVPVKRVLAGADPDSVVSASALANPEALDFFVNLARTRTIPEAVS